MIYVFAGCAALSGCFGGADPNNAPDWATTHVPDSLIPADGPPGTVVGVDFEQVATLEQDGGPIASEELTGILFLPDDRGALVWNKSGAISHYRVTPNGFVRLGRLQLPNIYDDGDCGLISLALDPSWEDNKYLYGAHCVSETFSQVTRYVFDEQRYEDVGASGATVITVGDPWASRPWHNVGSIGFFRDAEQSMWVLVGEKALPDEAQNMTSDLGAVLRILPQRDRWLAGYAPHPDNPFGGPGGTHADLMSSPDLYAWGLRSPWRGAIDEHDRIWIGDVGDAVEEINLAIHAGTNFGWNAMQGPCDDARCAQLTDPVAYWPRSANHPYRVDDPLATPSTSRVAWVGVPYAGGGPDVYEGFLDDSVLFSDMCIGYVRALSVDEQGTVTRDAHLGHLTGLSGSAQGPDGYLYVTAFGGCTAETGTRRGIYRVIPRRPAVLADVRTPQQPQHTIAEDPLGPMPETLSETGIFADALLTLPIDRAIGYEPAYPLWSNGSSKERWLLLPIGAKIDNSRRNAWEFPIGTLFVKTFAYGAAAPVRVETRVIRRALDGWEFYVYAWQDGDAKLLTLKHSIEVSVFDANGLEHSHVIPSRFECRSCHENSPSAIIGFDELRLSTPDRDADQLTHLAQAGVFSSAIPSDPDEIVHPDLRTRETLGYLHGNCAHCHNGAELAMSTLDLRHQHALEQLIGVPTQGSGQAAGVRIVPGSPEQSVLWRALAATGADAEIQPMPPLGVQMRDAAAIELIRDWIEDLPH